jgi:exopolysaccharide production protein ExoQ
VVMTAEKANPVRYSVPLMLFLTVCLIFAEHHSPVQVQNIDVDSLVANQSHQFSRQIAYIALALVGLIGSYHALIGQRSRLTWSMPVTIVLGSLFTWTVLSFLWTDTPETTARRLLVLGLMFLGAFGVSLSWTKTQVLVFMALSSALQITVGIAAELFYGYFTPLAGDYRFSGTLTANEQVYVCLLCTLSAMSVARLKHRGHRLYLIIAAYGFVFLLLTRSRSGLLAFALALIFYLYMALAPAGRVLTILVTGIVGLVLTMAGIIPGVFNLASRGGEGAENINGRAPLWEDLMTYVHQHPITGYGFEGFWTINRIDDISDDQEWAVSGAHSGYVEALLELGWTGAVLHTLALLVCMGEGIRRFRQTNEYAYLLGSTFCLVYLAGGSLEAISIVKTSESSFNFSVLLCLLAVRQRATSVSPDASQRVAIFTTREEPLVPRFVRS